MIRLKNSLELKGIIKRKCHRQYGIEKLISIEESCISEHISGALKLKGKNKEKIAKLFNLKKKEI